MIQQHAQPKQRTAYDHLNIVSYTYEYRSQTHPDNPPYQIIINHNNNYVSGTCTCPLNIVATANPTATDGKTWCKHLCALALLLVDPATQVGNGWLMGIHSLAFHPLSSRL